MEKAYPHKTTSETHNQAMDRISREEREAAEGCQQDRAKPYLPAAHNGIEADLLSE